MSNLEKQQNELGPTIRIKTDGGVSRSRSIIILAIFLAFSLIINLYFGVSWQNYKAAYDSQSKVLAEAKLAFEESKSTLSIKEIELKYAKSDLEYLRGEYEEAVALLVQYDSANKKLIEKDALSQIPSGYYDTNVIASNKTIKDLNNFLNFEFVLPKDYTLDVFDCSESAAYLEWVLQNNGFDAKIAVGAAPDGKPNAYHAWVIVFTDDHYRIAVEPTLLTGGVERILESAMSIFNKSARGVVYYNKENQTSINYYEGYSDLFDDIYTTVESEQSIGDWNWWEGVWGFQ